MASAIIHLAVAKKILEKIHVENEYDYYLGSIAPDIAILTNEFAGEVTDTVINKLSDDNYNIAIEWGMRSPLVPLKSMEMLHNKGYEVIVKFIVVDKQTSKDACKLRDDVMNNHNIILRRIPNINIIASIYYYFIIAFSSVKFMINYPTT